jgi:hypothetical protein
MQMSAIEPVIIKVVFATALALVVAVQIYAASRLFYERARNGIGYSSVAEPRARTSSTTINYGGMRAGVKLDQ